jgi:protoporphyrinogen/coproporphyrinogen III oxidase
LVSSGVVTKRIPALVIGGGISGLACAYALQKRGVHVALIEAANRAGGLIRSKADDGFLFELGPQSFSGTALLRGLCRELGIEDDLVHASPKAPRYVLVQGALRKVPLNSGAMVTSSLFSASTKLKITRDVFGRTLPPAEDESVARFVRRKFGEEVLDRLVGPFVSGIYAGDPERLSLRSTFPQLYEAEKSSGSIIRGMVRAAKSRKGPRERPTLLSFRHGNESLVRTLAAKLGPALELNTEANQIQRKSRDATGGLEVTIQRDGQIQTILADKLILATPAEVTGRLLGPLDTSIRATLDAIAYAPVAVVSLGYRREDVRHTLDGFGFLVPRSAGLRVLGTVWNSSLFPGRAPQGYALLTSFVGGATDPEAATLSQENLARLVHRELTPLLRIAKPPVCSQVQVYRRALPQYELGHDARLATLEELRMHFPNLWLIGNYLRGPSIGACIEQSFAVAAECSAGKD